MECEIYNEISEMHSRKAEFEDGIIDWFEDTRKE